MPPSGGSANTSVSSVNTEPHAAHEPTMRRRVSPPSTAVAERRLSPLNVSREAGTPNSRRHNPYMYNVLGENASPDLMARTSPLPRDPSPDACGAEVAQLHRNQSVDWDDEAPLQHQRPADVSFGAPGTTPSTPILGGYMAQCYSSVFPPGHLPSPMAEKPAAKPGRTSRRKQRGAEQRPPTIAMPSHESMTKSPSPEGSPTSAGPASMTRVYRNGRPVPVMAPRAEEH